MRKLFVLSCMAALALAAQSLAAEAPAAPRPLAGCFPPETVLYVDIPSLPDFLKGTKSTGLYALCQDETVRPIREFLSGKLQGQDSKNDMALFASFDNVLSSATGGGAFAMAPAPSGAGWLLVVEVGAEPSAAQAFLERFHAGQLRTGRPATRTNIGGIDCTSSGPGGAVSALSGGLLIMGSEDMFAGAAARLSGQSAAPSLSSSVVFTKAVSFLSAKPAFRLILDFPSVLAMARKMIPPASGVDADSLILQLGLNDVETVSLEGEFRLAGVYERTRISTTSADSKFITLIGRDRFDESTFACVPRQVLFCAGRANNPKVTFDTSRELLSAVGPLTGIDVAGLLSSVESKSGVSIGRDLLPYLGVNSIGYVYLPEGQPPATMSAGLGFEQVSLTQVTNEKAVSAAIDKVAAYAATDPQFLSALAPGFQKPPTIETATLGTFKITYLSVPGAPFASPAVAVYKGYLVYANNKDTVKSVADRLIAPGASIRDSDDYARVRGALARSPSQLAYFNVDRAIDLAYDNVMPMVAQQIDSANLRGDVPFTSAAIPPAYLVKRYVDGVGFSVSAGGNLVEIESYSPTGVVGLLGAGIASMALPSLMSRAPAAVQSAPADPNPSRARLVEIGRMLQVSTIERKGEFPAAITDVVPAEMLQAPQDPDISGPADYVYLPGLTTSSPGRRILVYEREGLTPDGRYVLHVDGSVEFLSEKDFREIIGSQQ